MELARRLSGGGWCSGEDMARMLGCSRAAVWKHVSALRELGVAVEARAGQGYRLAQPLELLDPVAIREALGARAAGLGGLDVVAETGSTNADLLTRRGDEVHRHALLAERQTGGRGRRGRPWFSPFARNIYLSLAWRFESGLGSLTFLPLVVAVSAARACEALGLTGHGLKWPNDIVLETDGALQKLGGCLVEVRGDLGGPCLAVMGVGLNVHMAGAPDLEAIDQPWADLGSRLHGVSRNRVAAVLLRNLLTDVAAYEKQGFEPFRDDWDRYDCLQGRTVTLRGETETVQGTARGLGPRGGLLVAHDGQVTEQLAGEARLRQAD